jgi:hypothetical protein
MTSKLKNPDLAALLLMAAALVVELVAQVSADATALGQLPAWAPPVLLGVAAAGRLYLGSRRAKLAEGDPEAVTQGLLAVGAGAAIGRAVGLALTEEPGIPEAEVDTDSGEVLP